jgi:hypothetical protein
MANDTDIFGELPKSATPSDSDIFKDASAPKAVAPVEQPKPQASADRRPLSPQQQAMVADMQARPWGSGLPKVMYDVGGRIADAGYPGVGAVVNAIPDALQIMMGGNVAAAGGKPVMEKAAQSLMRSP